MICNPFYARVRRHKVEICELTDGKAEQKVAHEFVQQSRQEMLIGCLYSRWQYDSTGLWSFTAVITDEPSAAMVAAGHDRCIVPINEDYLEDWLTLKPQKLEKLYAIFEDREHLYYEHHLAA